MPLSEHEQRLLEQMEKALYAEDPKFANNLRASGGAARGRAALGVIAVLAGLGLLVAGAATAVIPVGVLGFVVMLGGAFYAYSAFTAPAPEAAEGAEQSGGAPKASKPAKGARSGDFMSRMEERWRRRNGEG